MLGFFAESTLSQLYNGQIILNRKQYPIIKDDDNDDCELPDPLPELNEKELKRFSIIGQDTPRSDFEMASMKPVSTVNNDQVLNEYEFLYERRENVTYNCSRCVCVPIIERDQLICPQCRVVLCENYGLKGISWKTLSLGTYSEDSDDDYSAYNLPSSDGVARMYQLGDENFNEENEEGDTISPWLAPGSPSKSSSGELHKSEGSQPSPKTPVNQCNDKQCDNSVFLRISEDSKDSVSRFSASRTMGCQSLQTPTKKVSIAESPTSINDTRHINNNILNGTNVKDRTITPNINHETNESINYEDPSDDDGMELVEVFHFKRSSVY